MKCMMGYQHLVLFGYGEERDKLVSESLLKYCDHYMYNQWIQQVMGQQRLEVEKIFFQWR